MKFLLFNLTVAAALVYLFTTDRHQVQDTAGRIHDAASEVKQAARGMVDRTRRWTGQADPSAPMADPQRSAPNLSAKAPDTVPGLPPLRPPAIAAAPKTVAAKAPAPAPAPVLVKAAPQPASKPSAPLSLEAAALKRREEILAGIDPAVLTPGAKEASDAKVSGTNMAPEERRKQLHSLSEEMELFYAKTLGN